MNPKLYFFFVFVSIFSSAQTRDIIGTIYNEDGYKIPNVTIFNVRTEQKITSTASGDFIIPAQSYDRLRIVKEGYEIKIIPVQNAPLKITLIKLPTDIEEVKIAFQPTGNLKKDMNFFKPNEKVVALNSELSGYMRTPMQEVLPKNTIPSAFKPHDYSAGQINLLAVGKLLFGLTKAALGKTEDRSALNSIEKQKFYNRIKEEINLQYFYNYGLDEYDFDIFLAYTDRTQELSKKYGRKFNALAIESTLKSALKEFLKTHQVHG